jgi:hypothetical protein
MKGHAGAVLTGGFAAIALALVTLQAVVLSRGVPRQEPTAARSNTTNRYSAPGGRAGVPWLPFDKAQPPEKPALPESPEGRKPPQRQEQHQSPPPSRFRSAPPRLGPQRPRTAVA